MANRFINVIQSAFSPRSTTAHNRGKTVASPPSEEITPQNKIIQNQTEPSPEIFADDDPCTACANPCSTHASYPKYLKISHDPLEGTVKPYVKHVVISTGKTDWEERIEEVSGSFAASLTSALKNDVKKEKDKKKREKVHNGNQSENQTATPGSTVSLFSFQSEEKPRIVITNCSRDNSDNVPFSRGNDIFLFPDNILVRHVSQKSASAFREEFLTFNDAKEDHKEGSGSGVQFVVEPIPYKAVILICSHRHRDKRCGVTAPFLKEEFDKVLKDRGLDLESRKEHDDGVAVLMSSHIGGHKFAGNLIVYRNGQGIWYGRVTPCHAKLIVEKTVIEGKVIKDLYRGSMNGSFGPEKGGRLEW